MTQTLKRELSTLDLFTLGFGAIIGVGWIIIMGEWLTAAGPAGTILALILGAAAMAVIGLSYVEMATLLPVAGGEIAYGYETFGLKAAFAAGWCIVLAYVAGAAFEAIAVGWIAAIMAPGLKGPVLYTILGEEVHAGPLAIGVAGTLFLAWINYRSVKSAAIFQTLATGALILISLIFFIGALIGGDARHLEPLIARTASGSMLPGLTSVLATIPFFFIGFNIIPQALGEQAPGTGASPVRRTILMSIIASCIFYCAIVIASALLMPREQLASAELPVYAAAVGAFKSEAVGQLVLIAGLLGLVTTWNAVFYASTRVLLSLSRARTIPGRFSRLHPRFRTPAAATLLIAVINIVGTCLGRGAILPIVNALGVAIPVVFAMVCLGVCRLRRRGGPGMAGGRGLAMPLAGAVLSILLSAMALYQAGLSSDGAVPTEWLILLGWILLGALFWGAARSYRVAIGEEERRRLILSDLDSEAASPLAASPQREEQRRDRLAD